MICPSCKTAYHDSAARQQLGSDAEGGWFLLKGHCPECNRFNFRLVVYKDGEKIPEGEPGQFLVWPRVVSRPPCPEEVKKDAPEIAEDYRQACLVLQDSPKASAALSRRCLQSILREKSGVKPGNLNNEINEVLKAGKLPSYIADGIDAVRNIGNFAAHPLKSTNTGEIVDVEPGEAEWNLDVLEALFDFYWVQPEKLRARRDVLNAKLIDAGKPPMKLP